MLLSAYNALKCKATDIGLQSTDDSYSVVSSIITHIQYLIK